jgi:hypothetical protein
MTAIAFVHIFLPPGVPAGGGAPVQVHLSGIRVRELVVEQRQRS